MPQNVAELISLIPRDLARDREDPAALSRRLAAFFEGMESGAAVAGAPWGEVVESRAKRLSLAFCVSRAVASLILLGGGEDPPERPVAEGDGGEDQVSAKAAAYTSWLDPGAILSTCKLVTPDIPDSLVNLVTDWVTREYLRGLPFDSGAGAVASSPFEARRRLANGWAKAFAGAVLNYPFLRICETAVEGLARAASAKGGAGFSEREIATSLERAITADSEGRRLEFGFSPLCEGDFATAAHAVSEKVATRIVSLFGQGNGEEAVARAQRVAFDNLLAHFAAEGAAGL